MATASDFDTKALVSKFLSRQVVTSQLDNQADSAEEVTAILEAAATAFLLFPQTVLSIVLRAKNTLLQSVKVDISLIDYLTTTLLDLSNPSDLITDSSDIIEARTALVELDRLGRVATNLQAYTRYNTAINRFLDQKLAKPLKRHNRQRFERSGVEARQDMVQAVGTFAPTHQLVAQRLAELAASVQNFQSIDLTRLVSSRTLSRLRSSLSQLQQGVEQGTLSNTVVAVELLTGAASLQSIASTRSVYDPTVQTGRFPDARLITASAEPAPATALSSLGPWDISSVTPPWTLAFATDAASYSVDLPATGAGGRPYVVSSAPGSATRDIPASTKLYIMIDSTYFVVPLTTGASTPIATTIADINAVLGVSGTAAELYSGAGRFIIYGAGGSVQVVVLDIGRATAGGTVLASVSAHAVLGFGANQTSKGMGLFSATDLVDLVAGQAPTAVLAVEDDHLRVSSASAAPGSSLAFLAGVAVFPLILVGSFESEPAALVLMENGAPVSPASLGVFVGSRVSVSEVGLSNRSLVASVTSVDGDRLLFAQPLPRGTGLSVTILSPVEVAVQALLLSLPRLVGSLDRDLFELQKVLSPLFSQPTQAQLNDAATTLAKIRLKLTNPDPTNPAVLELLQNTQVSPDRDSFETAALQVIKSLEDRGLDRALDLLSRCLFSDFFSTTKDSASKSSRFLTAASSVVRNDFPLVLDEEDISDGTTVAGSNPDTDLLPGAEPSE